MEIRRTDDGKVIATVYQNFSPKDFEQYKRKIEASEFFGRIEHHYNRGLNRIRVISSFTESDYERLATPVLGN